MLFILRHGETTWNRAGRMQGGLDAPLTDLGVRQARRQGAILAAAGARGLPVFSSPQGRAVRTAEIALPGVEPTLDPRLSEVGMGAWQGLGMEAILPELSTGARHHHSFLWKFDAPGGERLSEMQARVAAFLDAVPRPAIVVTHGVTSVMLRGLCMGYDVEAMSSLEDRQGVVYLLRDDRQEVLEAPPSSPIIRP